MRRTVNLALAVSALIAFLAAPAFSQALKPIRPDLAQLADGRGAQLFNRSLTVEKEGGRAVARLDGRAGDGGALIDLVQVGDGVIEVDLRGKDVAQQSFLGIAFHIVDWTTYEAVYFRPFNFRAAGADRDTQQIREGLHGREVVFSPLGLGLGGV